MSHFVEQINEDGVTVHTNANYDAIALEAQTESETDGVILTAEEIERANTSEANHVARQYLASTDWYITRQAETGVEVPSDILTKRAEARASVTEA